MADTSTPPLSLHLTNYIVILILVLGFAWLWRDSQIRDQKTMALLEAAKATQSTSDKQANTQQQLALEQAEAQNKSLQRQLAEARTTEEQIALINRAAGDNVVQAPDHQAQNPSVEAPPVAATLSPEQVKTLAVDATTCKQAINQVSADKQVIEAKDNQIAARDSTIKAQDAEVKKARGNRMERVMKALKYVGIGVAVGSILAKAGVL